MSIHESAAELRFHTYAHREENCQKFPIRFVCGYLNSVKKLFPKIEPVSEQKIFYGEWKEGEMDKDEMEMADTVKQLALWCPYIKVEIINPGYDPKWIDQLKEDQIEYAD